MWTVVDYTLFSPTLISSLWWVTIPWPNSLDLHNQLHISWRCCHWFQMPNPEHSHTENTCTGLALWPCSVFGFSCKPDHNWMKCTKPQWSRVQEDNYYVRRISPNNCWRIQAGPNQHVIKTDLSSAKHLCCNSNKSTQTTVQNNNHS